MRAPRGVESTEAMSAAGVSFEAVDVLLGERTVLSGLDLEVGPGETVVLLGRSGSGKSTTLRLANALLLPTRGEVRVDGTPTRHLDPIRLRRRTGYILQEIGLFPHFSVARNVALVPGLLGWDTRAIEARVTEMLELVGLDPTLGTRLPGQLSGGQRQRVGIARALAARPERLLCDEPFGALDPVTRYELQREFRALTERVETTLLFVTHDVREALFLADRIAFLADDGRLAFVGTPDAFRTSTEPRVARFRDAGL